MTQAISAKRNPKSEGLPTEEAHKNHPAMLESKNDLTMPREEQGRWKEAEKLWLESVEDGHLKLGDKHPFTLESWHNLIELYKAWDEPEKAEE